MKKNHALFKRFALFLSWLPFAAPAQADKLTVGQPAPLFELTAQDASKISLDSRRGKGWTILYFYPKAGTPGCTTQACAFRDAIEILHEQNAEVFGISTDQVKDLLNFRQKHNLNFTLLSDPDAKVTEAYGVKMPVLKMAKRWTFILDPALVVQQIDNDVDPALDAQRVAESLKKLQANP